jgi:predicted lipid-binding transport protein (Tim44 family)
MAQRPAQPQAAAPAPAAAAPKPGMGRWLAPLAGLAAGIGLASLLGHMGGGAAEIVTAVLLGIVAVMGVMLVMRLMRNNNARPAPAGAGGQWPAMGAETEAAPPASQAVTRPVETIGAAPAPAIPAGFDVTGFVEQAKRNFVDLYAAHDRGALDVLREFCTESMFAELKREIESRGAAPQQVRILALEGDLLEVTTEGRQHWASVRFSGSLVEEQGAPAEPFNEVWNLCKPVDGSTGWLLAGIQQLN